LQDTLYDSSTNAVPEGQNMKPWTNIHKPSNIQE